MPARNRSPPGSQTTPDSNPFTHYLAIGRDLGLSIDRRKEFLAGGQYANSLVAQKAAALSLSIARERIDFTCSGNPDISAIMVMRNCSGSTLMTLASLPGKLHRRR